MSVNNFKTATLTGGAIKIENGNFAWSSNATEPILKGIQMNVKKGSLVAVVGQVIKSAYRIQRHLVHITWRLIN